MLEEIKKEFDCLPIKKNLYDTDEGQTFIAELIAVDKRNLWQFIEQKLTEAIKSAKVEENGISSCMHCYAYEMTKEEHLQNFCSRWCVRMDKLYGWNVETDGCHKFEKSLRINELKGDK